LLLIVTQAIQTYHTHGHRIVNKYQTCFPLLIITTVTNPQNSLVIQHTNDNLTQILNLLT